MKGESGKQNIGPRRREGVKFTAGEFTAAMWTHRPGQEYDAALVRKSRERILAAHARSVDAHLPLKEEKVIEELTD